MVELHGHWEVGSVEFTQWQLSDFVTRLCEAKDAALIKERELCTEYIEQRNEVQAMIAMQADVLADIIPFIGYQQHVPHLVKRAEDAKEATAETVAAWRAKETEPLRREVAMLRDTLMFCQAFTLSSELHKLIGESLTDTQATALAYEREVKAKALEELKHRVDSSGLTIVGILNTMLAEIRASKGE